MVVVASARRDGDDVSHGRPTVGPPNPSFVVSHSVQSHSQKNRQTRAIQAEDARPLARTAGNEDSRRMQVQ